MRCRSARKLVFEYIDGLTDDAKRLELEKHLAECTECEKLASDLTRSMDLLHRAPLESPDENFGWKVRLKLNQERNAIQDRGLSPGVLFRSWNLRYAAGVGAAFVVVVAMGLMAFNSGLSVFDSGQRQGNAELVDNQPVTTVAENSAPPTEDADAAGGEGERNQSAPELFVPNGRSLNRPVSVGGGAIEGRPDVASVIDETPEPAAFNVDSIIKSELKELTPEARIRYLEGRLRLLQRHLNECKSVRKDN